MYVAKYILSELVLERVLGVPSTRVFLGLTAWHPRILADQLTLFKSEGQIMPTTLLLKNPNKALNYDSGRKHKIFY